MNDGQTYLLTLSLSVGCAVQNPAYMETGSTGGGDSETHTTARTSPDATPDSATAGGATSKDGPATNAAVTGPPDSDDSGSNGTTMVGSSSGSTTADTTDVDTESDEAVVILFATEPVPGNFAEVGPTWEAGEEMCGGTLRDYGVGLDCSAVASLVATEANTFIDIGMAHPELVSGQFVDTNFEPVAMSYAQLVLGDVEADFPDAVTAHLGKPNDPTFWWGPASVGAAPHCQDWAIANGTGRALTFDSAGGSGPIASEGTCNLPRHVLCACFAIR